MLRRVAAFCRPLRPVLLLVPFPRWRSPVVGVLGLCWMWHGVPFARQRRPIIGVLRMCWLLPGSFDCFCCPHTSVHRPSIACLAVFLCSPGALFLHALSGPSTICPFPPHVWSAPDGLPLLLRKQPIWWLALLACDSAYWPLALVPSAMTRDSRAKNGNVRHTSHHITSQQTAWDCNVWYSVVMNRMHNHRHD